jgi:quinol monooxygenase YgiN
MSFVFMVFHWPEPDKVDALAAGMREMREVLLAERGCLGVEPPHMTEDGLCLVGISKWESKEAFETAITLRPADEIVEGETRRRERFLLDEVGE